jgi:glycosyltransferase involved in cell wall biosynthesis
MRVLYFGPIGNSSAANGGYGFIANSFDKLFQKMHLRHDLDDYTVISSNRQQNEIALHEFYDVGIILVHPDSFKDANFKKNIETLKKYCNKFYLHLFWECSSLPLSWDWLFTEDLFTGFIASSTFVRSLIDDKIKEFSSNKKSFIVHPVFYKEDYINCEIDITQKLKEKYFTVLYVGQYTKRKGMEEVIVAFTNAFKDNLDCKLILKYHRLSQMEFEESDFIKRTVAMNSKKFMPHIYQVTDNLNRDQVFDLYKSASCLLFLSRGEGFGLPITESSIVGLPIIYADNSSCSEVIGSNRQTAVSCYQDSAIGMAQYNYDSNSTYGIPSISETIDALKYYYDMWKYNRENYYTSRTDDFNISIFEKFSEKNAVEQINKLM